MFRPLDNTLVDTPANWEASNPIILYGVIAVNSDGSGLKVGDGITAWSSLSYLGANTLVNKAIQTSRDPVNNELLVFCDAQDKWVFRLQGCSDSETNWAADTTTYPTYTVLVELDDYTNIPTGRFKFGDGVTSFPSLPWFGSEFDLTSWPVGYSVEFNGTAFEAASYVHPHDLQASTVPIGAFHRDDGTWALVSDTYITGPLTSVDGEFMLFDGTDGNAAKGSGLTVADMVASTGTPNEYFQINTGVKLYNDGGELHVKDSLDAYSDVRVESLYSSYATCATIVVGSYPSESTSVSLTSDGTYLYVDGSKLIDLAHDGSGSSFDADTVDGYHSTYFEPATHAAVTYPTVPTASTVDNFVSFDSTDGLVLKDSGSNASTFATVDHEHTASTIPMTYKVGATFTTIQDWANSIQSSGRISGGDITAHSPADGSIDVSALTGFIKLTDSPIGSVEFFDHAGSTSVPLTDNSINYIYMDYNSGNPQILVTTDRSTIKYTNQFNIGRAFRDDTSVSVLTSGINLYNRVRLTHEKWIDTFGGISYANGLITSCTGLNPIMTAGTLYAGSNKISIDTIDCSASDTFTYFYTTDSGSTWTEVATNTIDNTNYNNISTGLSALTTNRYGVHWVYVCPEGSMYVLYGKGDYTLAQAQSATVSNPIPNYLSQWCKLAAKIIVQKSSLSIYSVTLSWETAFPIQNPGEHNTLAGLQGGTTDQYYHLTAAQYASTPMYWGELASEPATYKAGDTWYDTSSTGELKTYITSVGWITIGTP